MTLLRRIQSFWRIGSDRCNAFLSLLCGWNKSLTSKPENITNSFLSFFPVTKAWTAQKSLPDLTLCPSSVTFTWTKHFGTNPPNSTHRASSMTRERSRSQSSSCVSPNHCRNQLFLIFIHPQQLLESADECASATPWPDWNSSCSSRRWCISSMSCCHPAQSCRAWKEIPAWQSRPTDSPSAWRSAL